MGPLSLDRLLTTYLYDRLSRKELRVLPALSKLTSPPPHNFYRGAVYSCVVAHKFCFSSISLAKQFSSAFLRR